MKRQILFPRLMESRIHLLGYCVSAICIVLILVLRSDSSHSYILLFGGLLAFTAMKRLFQSKIVIIDEAQIKVFFHGLIVRCVSWNNVISVGVWNRLNNPPELYICATPKATIMSFCKKHNQTAKNLFPGKKYELAQATPEGQWEMALAVYLAKRGDEDKAVIMIPMRETYINQLACFWHDDWTNISV